MNRLVTWWIWHMWTDEDRRQVMMAILERQYPGRHIHKDPKKAAMKGGEDGRLSGI